MNNALRFFCLCALLWLGLGPAQAVTYSNVSLPFNWIDASAHNRLGASSSPYRLRSLSGCGTAVPIIDDTISDLIPIGFTFKFGGNDYTSLRINTNGRIQLGDNTYCGSGTQNVGPPQTYPYRYPDANVGASMRIYGADLDPTPQGTAGYTTNCVAGSCYLSWAVLGVAPYRSFVATWNNVPEWIGTSRAGGNFNLQIILHENGEFIYQYGVNVHGASGIAEIGWQVSTADYAVPGFGLPANNSAIKFYIPQPVAEYRMEQPSWNGTAGEVIDSSGNGRHGVRLGSALTVASKVCRGASIPSNAAVNLLDGVQTPVNIGTTVGGQGSITFWYKSNSRWNAANGDRQLFDATAAGNRWFFLTRRTTTGRLRFVLTDTGNNVRALEVGTNNTTAANTWRHIAVTWNFNALAATNSDRMRIYIDGAQVAETTFSTPETLNALIGNLVIGDNNGVINPVGQNGSGNSADGIIDEFRIYNFEAGIGLIQRDMNASGCLGSYGIAAVDGSTCQAGKVTVTAYDAADNLLIMPNNTTMITLSTNTGRGNWSLISGYGVLNNGTANDGVATYLFNGEYQAIFAYQTDTSGSVNVDVSDGQLRESPLRDPSFTMAACSVSFNACELKAAPAPRCVPTAPPMLDYARLLTKLAGKAFALDAVAVKDGLLNTGFSGTVNVELLANTNTGVVLGGNNCPATQAAVIPLGNVVFTSGRIPASGVTVAATALASVSPAYRAYRDVRVRFTCDSTNCAPAGLVVCGTDNFAVRPASFTVSAAALNNANLFGSPKQVAGTDFTMTAQAFADNGLVATGYNGSPQINKKANDTGSRCDLATDTDVYVNKVQSHDGTCVSALNDLNSHTSIISFSGADASSGAANGTFQYHDVGNFRLLQGAAFDQTFAAVDQGSDCIADSASNTPDANGKIGCNVANTTASAWVGRFYPSHVALISGNLKAACTPAAGTAFTYMGQPGLLLDYVLQAQSIGNQLVSKYSAVYPAASNPVFAGYATAYPSLGVIDQIAINGMPGFAGTLIPAARITGWPTPQWLGGERKVESASLTYTRPAGNPMVPDGPISSLIVGVRVTDSTDGVKVINRDVLDTAAVCAGNACTHISVKNPSAVPPETVPTPTQVRFGMLRLLPANGSELRDLSMTAQTMFWNGFGMVPNTDDSCTVVPKARRVLSAWNKNLQLNETVLNDADLTFAANAALGIPQGQGRLIFSKPGLGNNGSVRLTLELGAAGLGYLQGRWNGSAVYADDPFATAVFGGYKGVRQIIYMREN